MDFIDLKSQQARIKPALDRRMAAVLEHGQYILGPEVRAFESELSEFSKAKYALGCANGTDAIILCLRAMGIGPGDAVFCPSFTYCATAESIALIGAEPVFVDIDRDTYNMCPKSLERAITQVKDTGTYAAKAVIIVDLFGQCADYPALMPIIKAAGLKSISDGAQGFGSTLHGHLPTHWVDAMTTSFFPAKPLGCYGDGGAVFTNHKDIAEAIESLRFHGRGTKPYDNTRIGLNSRLDSLQAAILQCKLEIFPDEIKARNRVAARYNEAFAPLNTVKTPTVLEACVSTWAQYTIEVEDPDALFAHLKTMDIPSARYYPLPTHLQSAYVDFTRDADGLKNTEACKVRVISLPMHPYLDTDSQDQIINAVIEYLSKA